MSDSNSSPLYIGIDVGTGSARALLISSSGEALASHSQATLTLRSPSDSAIFQQSTQDIWAAICASVRGCLDQAGVHPHRVQGIGFDATCSLAVVDAGGKPVDVSPTLYGQEQHAKSLSRDERIVPNVILWADHRAHDEADTINATGHKVLDYVGGKMSLEMEIPKTLWLKKHLPASLFSQCQLFDLPDYLTYRATGSPARSTCSLVCKTSYLPPGVAGSTIGWSPDFLSAIGLGSLADTDYAQLGGIPGKNGLVLTAGQPVGAGLTPDAARDLGGLLPGTAVGSGLIDAYAGWVGTVAAPAINDAANGEAAAAAADAGPAAPLDLTASKHRLAAIAGTSTCYCVQSDNPSGIFVEGVWGPYADVVFPGFWQNEGGQSSTGQLIDFVIDTHPAAPALKAQCEAQSPPTGIFAALDAILSQLKERTGAPSLSHLTARANLHIYPDLHGNRSPLADPRMTGLISGLTLSSGAEDLALKYLATLEAIALQTRQIVEKMNARGHAIDSVYMSGSQARNATLMQLLADACGVKVLIPEGGGSTAVVKGAAILGRYAAEVQAKAKGRTDGDLQGGSGTHAAAPATATALPTQEAANAAGHASRDLLWQLMTSMTRAGHFVFPRDATRDAGAAAEKKLLDGKYKVFLEMIEVQRRWRGIMHEAGAQ